MSNERYWPRQLEEMLEDDTVPTIINQPLCAAVPLTLLPTKPRSLHAVLCEALTNTQALLARLDAVCKTSVGSGRISPSSVARLSSSSRTV
jgi:hypothetical protein